MTASLVERHPVQKGPPRTRIEQSVTVTADVEESGQFDRYWVPVLLMILYAVISTALFHNYYIDDSYIHARYAVNLAHGYGFAYNPGDAGSYGTTSPLFTLILAAVLHFVGNPLTAAKSIDLVLGSVNVALMYLFVLRQGPHVPSRRMLALLAALLWLINPLLMRWSTAGMETPLFLALLLGSLWMVVAATNGEHSQRFALGGVLAGLTILARPEGLLWAVVLACIPIMWAWTRTRGRPRYLRQLAWFGLGLAAVVLPWYVYALRVFGTVVPNTVLAKGAYLSKFSVPLLSYTRSFGTQLAAVSGGVIGLIVIVALLRVQDRRWAANAVRGAAYWLLPVFAFPIVFFVVYWANNGIVNSRYLVALFPSVDLVAISAATLVLASPVANTARVRGIAIGSAIWCILFGALTGKPILTEARLHAASNDRVVAVATWMATHTPRNATLAAGDIGVIGYYSGRYIIDTKGLITRAMISYRYSRHEIDFLRRIRPGYLWLRQAELDAVIPRRDQHILTPLTRTFYSSFSLSDHKGDYYVLYSINWNRL